MTGINAQIRSFILHKFPRTKKRALDDNLALLETGVIDSLGVLDVVGFLEQTFSIKIEDEELLPENFGSIESMSAFVHRKRVRVGAPTL